MERAQFLASFKETFKTWIALNNATYTTDGYVVNWSITELKYAWYGWVAAYETYAADVQGRLTGEYE